MTHVTCRLTAKNRDHLRNHTLGDRVWATFTFYGNLRAIWDHTVLPATRRRWHSRSFLFAIITFLARGPRKFWSDSKEVLILVCFDSTVVCHRLKPLRRLVRPLLLLQYCDERVCLCVFVCSRSYLRNYTSDLHQILCECYPWPWLGPPLAA